MIRKCLFSCCTFDLKMVQRSTETYSDFGRTVEVSIPRD